MASNDFPVDILLLSEGSALSIALKNIFELMGWSCRCAKVGVPSPATAYPTLQCLEPLPAARIIVLLHEESSLWQVSQFCCLAAKLRCPPVSSARPILVWSKERVPIGHFHTRIAPEDLTALGIAATALPPTLAAMLATITNALAANDSPSVRHTICLPVWVLKEEVETSSLGHDLSHYLEDEISREGGAPEVTEHWISPARALFEMVEAYARRQKENIMATKTVYYVDDAFVRTPGYLEVFSDGILALLNQHGQAEGVTYAMAPISRFERVVEKLREEVINAPDQQPILVMDLGEGATAANQAKARELIEKLRDEKAVTPFPFIVVCTRAQGGIAYQAALNRGIRIFSIRANSEKKQEIASCIHWGWNRSLS